MQATHPDKLEARGIEGNVSGRRANFRKLRTATPTPWHAPVVRGSLPVSAPRPDPRHCLRCRTRHARAPGIDPAAAPAAPSIGRGWLPRSRSTHRSVETLNAAVLASRECPGAETAALVRHRYDLQPRCAWEELDRDDPDRNGAACADSPPFASRTASSDGNDTGATVVRAAPKRDRADSWRFEPTARLGTQHSSVWRNSSTGPSPIGLSFSGQETQMEGHNGRRGGRSIDHADWSQHHPCCRDKRCRQAP